MEYSVRDFAHMMADEVRMPAYERALAQVMRPGSVVVDIGAGTGALSIAASHLGARTVYAIERDETIEVTRQIVALNGLDDRVICIEGLSSDVELPERADVIVSDLRGVLPLYRGHIRAIVDARSRLLAPDGMLIPSKDVLRAAVVEAHHEYERNVSVWEARNADMEPGRELVVNSWWRVKLDTQALVSGAATIGALDYMTIEDTRFHGAADLAVSRAGTAHGICVWFDTELAPGVGFSGAPGEPELIYQQAFFPLERPLSVVAGDTVAFELDASLLDDDYAFSWRTTVMRVGVELASFSQSTVLGELITAHRLAVSRADYVPDLPVSGHAARRALEAMNGTMTTGEIATLLLVEFRALFVGDRDALKYVVELVRRYDA